MILLDFFTIDFRNKCVVYYLRAHRGQKTINTITQGGNIMAVNIRSYKKMIREANIGDTFYLNAINASLTMIEYTRQLIQTGKITPDGEELNKMVKPEAQYKFYTGESIAPQMTYRVIA